MTENAKEQVGDFELVSLIGDGAQGRVYKARYAGASAGQFVQDEVVAIKLIRITGDDEKLRTKFQSQADILRRLSHPNIVRYRDSFAWHSGEWDEAQCLVMEFLEGETLTDRLKKANTGLPWAQVEEVFEQCLAGLIHARERGITHRDLKPSNIFITKDGQARIIDFDIARQDDSSQMSTAGWKGTFDYMAPDFIAIPGFRGDEVSDVYSLGVCFYQALTGSLPFEPLGDSAHIGYLNRWKDGGAPVPSFRPGVFRILSNAKPFVARCLAAKREQRYASFAAMLEDFRKIRARRIRHKNKDEYELLSVLGRGGFGEVFKARRVSDGALVAVKHLFAEKQSERFIKEAKILQQYPHPNLVKYIDFMIVEGTGGEKQYFLILEFLEGMPGWTLRTRLKNESRLDASEALPLYIGFLSALQFLHENSRPIIHRDIKPGNLYAPAGQPEKGKIFDLGVARDVSGTVTVGGVPGTLDYMPPEFADVGGDRGSPQSDIYALGLCLYESLAGRPVYERLPTDMNSAWVAFQQRLRKPVELSFEGDASRQYPRMKGVILKALAPRPADRYRSAAEMKKDLENILAGTGLEDGSSDDFQVEMTVATLHSFSNENELPPPEPGATMGTRPLEGVEKTMPAPVNLIEAGKAEAERRKRRKVLVMGASIAAGLLLVAGVASWVIGSLTTRNAAESAQKMEQAIQDVEQTAGELKSPAPTTAYVRSLQEAYVKAVKTGEKYPEISDRVDEQRRAMRKTGAALPAEFRRAFDAAMGAGKTDKAAELLKEWKASEKYADIMGLTSERVAAIRDEMESGLQRVAVEWNAGRLSKVMDRIASARDVAVVRSVVADFGVLEKDPAFKLPPAQIKSAEDAIAAKYLLFAREKAGQAKAAYDGDRMAEGQSKDKELSALVAGVPERFGGKSLSGVAQDVGVSRVAAATRLERTAEVRKNSLQDAVKTLGEFRARIGRGNLESCVDGAKIMVDIGAVALSDPSLKSQWQAAADEYEKLIEETLRQKDPLAQRARRIKAADEILNDAAIEKVLTAQVKALRDNLAKQKTIFVVRLSNKSGEDVQISGQELNGKLKVLKDASRELELPVRPSAVPASLLVEGRVDTKPRIESVQVSGAGGLELVIAPLEKILPIQKSLPVEKPLPVEKTSIVDKPPVEVERVVPPVIKSAVMSKNKGLLDISVAPKVASITVDGNSVKAGSIEVSPDENHKIMVEASGYKPCLQYYRVRTGEVRKIEIFLEKEVKRSMFGW